MNCGNLVGCRSSARLLGLTALAAAALLVAPALRAQDNAQEVRAVRLSSVEGQVRILQGTQVLADPALANTPLFEGAQVLTSGDGRAELEFEDGSVVRLSPNSSLMLALLRGQGSAGGNAAGDAEIVLQSGLGYFELQGQSEGPPRPIRVRFGDSVVTADGSTVLRVNLDNPPGELAIFSGNAHLESGNSQHGGALTLDLHGGESVALNGADLAGSIVAESVEPDSWDTWNSDRDQLLAAEATAKTGAAGNLPDSNNPAWGDLDANGSWYSVPGEGSIWSPYEATNAGWEPYGNGNWMWTPRFGYIWVSGDAWGYLPYQYGTWNFYDDFGWGWAPGICQPWWGGGRWFANVGIPPHGYRPPMRPHPMLPRSGGGRPLNGALAAGPHPIVAVNRLPQGGGAALPTHTRYGPVTIGGRLVQPMRPLSPRPLYNGSAAGAVNRSRSAYAGSGAPVVQHSASGSATAGGRAVYAPSARSSGGSQPAPSYSRPSGGGGGGGSHAGSGGTGSSGPHR